MSPDGGEDVELLDRADTEHLGELVGDRASEQSALEALGLQAVPHGHQRQLAWASERFTTRRGLLLLGLVLLVVATGFIGVHTRIRRERSRRDEEASLRARREGAAQKWWASWPSVSFDFGDVTKTRFDFGDVTETLGVKPFGWLEPELPTTTTETNTTTTSTATTTTATTTSTSTTRTTTATTSMSQTLFCWMVITLHGGMQDEVALARLQWREQLGIFQCERARVYADQEVSLDPGNKSAPSSIPHGMSMATKGPKGWLMNVQTFLKVWDMIFKEGAYRGYGFTVKVDPDTVFLPHRLRQKMLQPPLPPTTPWHFRNCKGPGWVSMQGPMEVISSAGVERLAASVQSCQWTVTAAAFGGDPPGEDMFVDHCLVDHGSRAILDESILADKDCGWPLQAPCDSAWRTAYHWFKDENTWKQCLKQTLDKFKG